MSIQDVEFKVGDIVTFYPYEFEYKAKVTEVSLFNIRGVKDSTVYYTLTGTEYLENGRKMHSQVNSVTSGLSIKESKYFKKYDHASGWD
jgi:hypothetical protein